MTGEPNRGDDAFRRLLSDGNAGGQAKIDALLALSQRTVYVATWTPDGGGYRTLINSAGDAALPIFTTPAELLEAGRRFGWLDTQGNIPMKEVGAREAIRQAVAHEVAFVVIDIAAAHTLEVARSELEPLLTAQARRESDGPFAGVGRISTSMMRAVTPAGGSPRPNVPAPAVSATFGSGTSVELSPLAATPEESLLKALADVLRGYPEVEWASLANVSRGPTSPIPTVGLRVDTAYRARVQEILTRVREAGDAMGASLDCLLLDDAQVMRAARSQGLVFYPWRRR